MRGAILSGDHRKAIFEKAGAADYLQLTEGEMIDGWTLIKVEPTSALLQHQDRSLTMSLEPAEPQP